MTEMEQAGAVFAALREGRLRLAREPVCGTQEPGRVLYEECLARVEGEPGLVPGQFIPVLERLALVCAFDRHVMRRVIGLLRAGAQATLGVNLSARSLVPVVAWEALLRQLADRGDVAARLVVEITETARLEVEPGRRFVQRLRQAGCRVAIDDFGAGYGVETAMAIGTPDIVKIDASFVAAARGSDAGMARLAAMVRLAADLAPQVVVEGVEQEQDLWHAREAGAQWAQGRFFSAAGTGGHDAPGCRGQ